MRKKTIGIYYIVNNLNGKYYIGSSKNIEQRFTHHRYKLRCNKHTSHYLQRAWNKHGKDNFSFVVICELLPTTDKSYLNELEQYFLDNADYENVYNLAKIVGRPPERDMRKEKHPRYGMHTPEHQKQAISLANRKSGSGIKKVSENRYSVTFSVKGKLQSLGSFRTYEEALEIRLLAEKRYWGNDDSIILPKPVKLQANQIKTGKEGIYQKPNGKYKVRIKRKDVFIHVGTFKTFQEAYDARQEALQKIFQGD